MARQKSNRKNRSEDSHHKIHHLGNWNRWGVDDERGTLNLISQKVVKDSVNLVRQGKIISLGLPIIHNGVDIPSFPHRLPPLHLASFAKRPDGSGTADDYVLLNTHNHTHIDSLAHDWRNGRLYNGFSLSYITSNGAEKCGIDKIGAIVTKGVLLDIAKHKHVDSMRKGERISAKDLLTCAKNEAVSFTEGDAVLIRTGYMSSFQKENEKSFFEGAPGLDLTTARLFDRSMSSIVGADTPFLEVVQNVRSMSWPLHTELLWMRGMSLIEMLNLEELARERIYEFLFVALPLKIVGGLGSPINPIAVY